jgi:4-diphosphocytidyl-2-C-methyl-D-erythritol kinase
VSERPDHHREAPSGAVRVSAPGKLNLGLRVAALRGDGYHEIDTLFVTVSEADRLTVARWDGPVDGVVRSDPKAAGGAVPDRFADNLAARAAAAWLHAAGAEGGAWIELDKRLPVAAGLGGGSSDAGAVLRAMARLAPADVDTAALAKRLGSDVPFFAAGLPAARGRGRGERLRPLSLPPRWLVLLNPGVPVAAGDAYRALGAFGPPIDWEVVAAAWRDGGTPPWRNDLQPGVLRAHPDVRRALDALRAEDLTAPLLSGSGATCFGLARDEARARAVAGRLRAAWPDAWVRAVRAPAEPETFEVAAEPR